MVCSYTLEQRLSVVQTSISLHCSCRVNRYCLPLPSWSGMGSFTGDNQNHISNFQERESESVAFLQNGGRRIKWWDWMLSICSWQPAGQVFHWHTRHCYVRSWTCLLSRLNESHRKSSSLLYYPFRSFHHSLLSYYFNFSAYMGIIDE